MSESPQVLLEAVEALARLTGEVALRHFRTTLAIETKDDGSPVTRADREAEAAARLWIERRCPTDGIVGEESGTTRPCVSSCSVSSPIAVAAFSAPSTSPGSRKCLLCCV